MVDALESAEGRATASERRWLSVLGNRDPSVNAGATMKSTSNSSQLGFCNFMLHDIAMVANYVSTGMPRPLDPICAALLELAESELGNGRFVAAAEVARMACGRAPDEPAPQRLLANAAQEGHELADDQRANFYVVRAHAHRLLGDPVKAEVDFRTALHWDTDCLPAHLGLAEVRFLGENYQMWLEKLHKLLRPRLYLEIGVYKGHSLVLARPPTRTIGIDPDPCLEVSFEADTQIYRETSDAFFTDARLEDRLGQPPDLAFIDGLHRFEQALRDFINIEAHSGPQSVVLIHDTVPLDEPTQRRTRSTSFYTGDVWKAVLCLRHYRPDLDIVTVATPPTGLTIVTALDGSSRILADRYDEAVKRFMDLSYADVENRLGEELNIVANDWNAVAARLEARGT